MLPYWLFFLLPALPALGEQPKVRRPFDGRRKIMTLDVSWVLMILFFTVVIGWRFEVGGDWFNYLLYIREAVHLSVYEALLRKDPGYWLLNVIAVQAGWGILGVNVVAAFIFATGLAFFCRSLPLPWLAIAVAVPYLVIVVGMGYSRQAVALGLVMLGMVALGNNKYYWFVVWVALGATFHKSAVLLLPLAALTVTKNRYQAIAVVAVATAIGYRVLLERDVDTLITNYINADLQSSGTLIRLVMNALPAGIFLYNRNRFKMPEAEKKLWLLFSALSVALLVLFFTITASTAVDRMALYLIPLQLVVFSHLPLAFGKKGKRDGKVAAAILGGYALVLFVWLNFANNSYAWVPYRMNF